MTTARKPHENTRLAKFLQKRILELRPKKSQAQIATEVGFNNTNVLAMIKLAGLRQAPDRPGAEAGSCAGDRPGRVASPGNGTDAWRYNRRGAQGDLWDGRLP
jgi:hypothetical protein